MKRPSTWRSWPCPRVIRWPPCDHLLLASGLVAPSSARTRRRMEEHNGGVLSDGSAAALPVGPGSTRRGRQQGLAAAGFDLRWMTLVRDGWLNPVGLRPDGSGITVESDDFFLKNVSAEVAEELTAEEIVFAAIKAVATDVPDVTVVAVAVDGGGGRGVQR